jgi:hypothetical protein
MRPAYAIQREIITLDTVLGHVYTLMDLRGLIEHPLCTVLRDKKIALLQDLIDTEVRENGLD